MPHSLHSVPLATALPGAASETVPADSCQAQYFRCLLDTERAKLDDRIVKDLRKLSRLGGLDEAVGAKALRRRIRVMQRQRHELDRLIQALDCRLNSWDTPKDGRNRSVPAVNR